MSLIYLDNAATTPLDPEVRQAMAPWLDADFGNPSSRHPLGVRAAEALDAARQEVARALGAQNGRVVFTSGGTESNNLAVLGLARAAHRHGNHLVIGEGEHPSVRDAALALVDEGFELDEVAPTAAAFSAALRPSTVLASCMLVNNETGVIAPVEAIASAVHGAAPRARFHVDAVQGLGKFELSLRALGADSLSISGHKVHGPKGTGALALADGVTPVPLVFGGGQEEGLRSGTENVAGLVGLGRAAKLADERQSESHRHMSSLWEPLRAALAPLAGVRILADETGSPTTPSIATLVLPAGPPSEVVMHHLEERGVMTSAGSACHSRNDAVSPALGAHGLSAEEALRVLRISFSCSTTAAEVQTGVEALVAVHRTLEAKVR